MVESMAHKLNQQRNVDIDFALIEDADHMYNNHLGDLYKVSGQYVISALQHRSPLQKRRGRRKKSDMEDDLLLDGPEEDDILDNSADDSDDFDNEE